MTLPSEWQSLPGPAEYLARIRRDLQDGYSVWAYFRDAPENLSIRIVPRGWRMLRVSKCSDLDSNRLQDGVIYLCELQSDSKTFRDKFVDSVALMRSQGSFPRICVSTRSNEQESTAALRSVDGIRVRVWSDFVRLFDSRIVVDRVGRKEGWSVGYADIMGSVISQIVKNDLRQAAIYAKMTFPEIISDPSLNREDIWIGQMQVLFPQIYRLTQAMIRKYSSVWQIPWEVYYGDTVVRTVTNLKDLEVSHLVAQAKRLSSIEPQDQEHLQYAKRIRDDLAHCDVVGWDTLSSKDGARVFDIRLPDRSS